MKGSILLLLGLSVLSACAYDKEVGVTYTCEPSGAVIYEEGIGRVGVCPVILKYNPNDVKIGGGRLNTHKISVVWASGASLLVSPMSVEIPSDGMASLNFMRPQDFPDYEKDRKFSASFEGGVPTPVEKFVVSPNQDKDLFASLNRNVSCAIGSLIVSLDTRCP